MFHPNDQQFFCLVLTTLILSASVAIAWARAFGARRTGRWPHDDPDVSDRRQDDSNE